DRDHVGIASNLDAGLVEVGDAEAIHGAAGGTVAEAQAVDVRGHQAIEFDLWSSRVAGVRARIDDELLTDGPERRLQRDHGALWQVELDPVGPGIGCGRGDRGPQRAAPASA